MKRNTTPTVSILSLLLLTIGLHAQQQVNKDFPATGITKIHLDFTYADATISTWSGNSVQITGTVDINYGENNDNFKLESNKNGDVLNISSTIENFNKLPRTIMVVKDGEKYYFRQKKGENRDIEELIEEQLGDGSFSMYGYMVKKELKLEVKVPLGKSVKITSEHGDLSIEEYASDLKVRNTHGHIIAAIAPNSAAQQLDLHSTHSFVDVSVPQNLALDIELDSDHGKIYSDLDFEIDTGRSQVKSHSSRIVAKLNNGGKYLRAKSTHNNIYLRKSL